MSNLTALAAQYQINTAKPFFPVNSLRLFYFLICDHYTQSDAATREKMTQLIPVVESLFDARGEHRSTATAPSTQGDVEAAESQLNQVFELIDTPVVRNVFSQLFTYMYPLQDEVFLGLYQDLMSEAPATPQHLHLLLQARAMDSVVFSTLLHQIILLVAPLQDAAREQQFQLSLHHHVNLAYQLNDIVDAVVFAKDDLEAGSFSPFRLIQKITPEPEQAKELITTSLANLQQKGELFVFPPDLQEKVMLFYKELASVVHPQS